ncbi:YfhO family protein [Marinicella gelatinilytica]|uniref:YfhO family protein n=1 Tax=Marinicella gelatinilytica TaxID=2996017 RepID=UPI002260ABB7|nr:YfhO family protein [Marinicella gelatinilytica]MCX7544237.1 YfhO family protein [Marinicella gelatinilytica]
MNQVSPECSNYRQDRLWALLVYGLMGLVFFYPVLLGYLISQSDYLFFVSPWNSVRPDDLLAASNPYLQDQTTEFLAFFLTAKSQILQGMWPLWNPFILTGTPLLANTQSALLFPLNWGHFVLPAGWGFTVSALLKVILAPWFTYLLARRLRLSHASALIAGVAFGFCAFYVFWLNHPHSNVTLLIPLCFYTTENLLARQGIREVALLALITAVTLFAGHVEIALYTGMACAVYLLVRALQLGQMRWRLWFQFGAAYVASLLLTAVMMLPFLEFLTVAAVWEERSNFVHYTMPISAMATGMYADIFRLPGWSEHYLGFHISSLYMGVTALPLVLIGVVKGGRQMCPWLTVLVLSMMLAFDIGPLYDVVKHLPVLGHLPLFYWAVLIAFSGSMLAAIGWQCCIDSQIKKMTIGFVVLFILAMVWVVAFFWQGTDYQEALENVALLTSALKQRAWLITLLILGVALLMYLAQSKSRWVSLIMVTVLFADLWWFNHGWNPTVDANHVFPNETPKSIQFLQQQAGPYRVLGLNHILKPSTNMLAELEDVRGYDVPVSKRYHRFFKQALQGTVAYWVYEKTTLESNLLPYLNLHNVRYILAKTALPEEFEMDLIYDDDIKIYENTAAEARLFYRQQAKLVATPDSALETLLQQPQALSNQVIIESSDKPRTQESDRVAEVKNTTMSFELIAHHAQKLTADVNMAQSGWLVHAAAFYPGWRAYVDDKRVPLYAANYTQQGIYLPAGKHRVRFHYQPWSFTIGLLLSLLSFAGLLWILIKNKK